MQFSRSLLPRSVEKRPRRLWLEIEIKWHSKCNRLYLRKPSRVTCESVISHLWPRHVTHGCVMSHMNWSFLHPSALMKHQHTHTHIHTHTYTHDLSRHSGALIHVRPLQWRNDMHTHTHTQTDTHYLSATSVRWLNLPASMAKSSFCRRACARLLTFSSTVFGVMRRSTNVCFFWPSLHYRCYLINGGGKGN